MKKRFLLSALLMGSMFSLHAQLVPNGSFEDWASQTLFEEPDSFMTTNMQAYFSSGIQNVEKTTDCHGGNFAVRLETMQSGPDFLPGGIFIGTPGEDWIEGGIPYTGVPDSVHVWAKYSITPGDTAGIVIFLKSNSQLIAISFLQFTGNQPNYSLEASPVEWFTWGIPDTISIAAFSSSPDNSSGTGSVLFLDDISLTGTLEQLPNSGFEHWTALGFEDPEQWMSSNFITISGGGTSALKSSEHVDGNYSLRLETKLTAWDDSISFITNGHIGDNGPAGGIPVSGVPEKFTFYYKSTPVGADSSVAGAWLLYYDPGLDSVITLEEIFISLPPATDWTYFEVPFNYIGPDIPDTLNIAFSSSHVEETAGEVCLGSVLYVDKVELVPTISIEEKEITRPEELLISPNPVVDYLNIWIPAKSSFPLKITLLDAFGKVCIETSLNVPKGYVSLHVSDLKPGIYYIKIQSDKGLYSAKCVKI